MDYLRLKIVTVLKKSYSWIIDSYDVTSASHLSDLLPSGLFYFKDYCANYMAANPDFFVLTSKINKKGGTLCLYSLK